MTEKGGGSPLDETDATVQRLAICSLENFALVTQLPLNFLQQIGFTQAYLAGQIAVRIVCRGEDGGPGSVLFQTGLEGEERYQWRSGDRPMPYGLESLAKARDQGRLLLVRHVSDALALRRVGLPALALLDAHSNLDALTAPLRSLPAIYVLATEASRVSVCQWVGRSGLAPRVQTLAIPGEAADLTAVYRDAPDRFVETMNHALEATVPWETAERARREAEKERARVLCEALAGHERILNLFAETLHRAGFAGDSTSAQILFLSLTSRLLELPVSMVLKGPSAGGKSFLLKTVMDYFPERAHYMVSSLSPRALTYLKEPLSNRMLVVAEYDGMEEKRQEYLLRTLLSEGRIAYAVPMHVDGRWVTRQVVVEGPTGLILTTTRLKLHPENETRMLSVEINDTAEQTRAILQAQAHGAGGGEGPAPPDFTAWHALQTWLQNGENEIVIPYAARIAERMSAHSVVRLRRDFPRVLQMIKAHALLHQANRERDTSNRIVATLADYAVVHALMAAHLAVDIEATVPVDIRETVEAVVRLSEDGKAVSLTALARELGLDKSSVSRRVARAIQVGLLRNRETRNGLPARLVPGDELPGLGEVLPSPDAIGD